VLLLVAPGSKTAAVVGIALAAASFAYAWRVFIGFGAERTAERSNTGWSLPVAVGAGLATLFAVHFDPLGSPRTVGTVALVNVAASVLVVVLYGVTRAASRYLAPGLLQL